MKSRVTIGGQTLVIDDEIEEEAVHVSLTMPYSSIVLPRDAWRALVTLSQVENSPNA